ncbi:hypothetical protein F4804DRAFT_102894 [Jackrogersella minutella]|nr:hypothetical protein F4804DRAFT_102894 [Jackrogersella minutella]
MDMLPVELILHVAEQLDIKSIVKFMCTNKRTHSILCDQQQYFFLRRLPQFMVAPSSDVFSSEIYLRRPLQYASFEMAYEMETRTARIEAIIASEFADVTSGADIGALSLEQHKYLAYILKRAMSHCDYIADIAAHTPCKPIAKIWYEKIQTDWKAFDVPLGYRLMDPYTNLEARPVQAAYIQTLPAEDLVMIYFLLEVLKTSFINANFERYEDDTSFPERIDVFGECVLRHGSWFAYSYILGGAPWDAMANDIMVLGDVERIGFELGEVDTPTSLGVSVRERFEELFPCEKRSEDAKNGVSHTLDPLYALEPQGERLRAAITYIVTGKAEGADIEDEAIEEATEE